MNRPAKNAVICLIILLCIFDLSWAGEKSFSIKVSCKIPAIPGVNAPLLTQEEEANTNNEEPNEEITAIAKKEKNKDMLLADNKTISGMVQTMYER